MKVAAIQHDIVWEDAESTRKRLVPLIAQAAAADARLIAVTEMYATGFSMRPERIAEQPGGPNELFLVDQAREHGAWLAGSIAQWEPNGRARNVAVLAGPDGTVHRYAKIHPFGYSGEDQHYEAGTEFLTVDVEGLRTSVFVCYDLRFADEFWVRARDTDCYVLPSNWPAARRDHWMTLLRARAIENQAYVVGVNRVGAVNELNHVGDSAIIDPLGRTLAEASIGEAVVIADVTSEQVRQVRESLPFLGDRR